MTGKQNNDNVQESQPTNDRAQPQRTDSGLSQQAEQQQMNSEAQRQAATQRQNRPQGQTIKDAQGNEIPFFPAPIGHASNHMTRNAQRAREQERTAAKVDLPDSAKPEALANARVTVMPAGGLLALAEQLFPDDLDNQDAMDGHLQDLLNLNRDSLRDDTAYFPGQVVRIPG